MCVESIDFCFTELSGSAHKSAKTEKKLCGYWWPHQEFSGSGKFPEYLIFLLNFFEKIQVKVLHLKIQLIFSILWVWHLKIAPKSKKWSESIKHTWSRLFLKLTERLVPVHWIQYHHEFGQKFLSFQCSRLSEKTFSNNTVTENQSETNETKYC